MLVRAGLSALIIGVIFVVSPARRSQDPIPLAAYIDGAATGLPGVVDANLATDLMRQGAMSSAAGLLRKAWEPDAPPAPSAPAARPTLDTLRPADRRAAWRGPAEN